MLLVLIFLLLWTEKVGDVCLCASLVSKSENAKEVLCALRWPLSASKSENAAKVRPLNNCPTPSSSLPLPPVQRINSLQQWSALSTSATPPS